jgi:WD40 repeat protein
MQLNVQTTSAAEVQTTPIEPYVGPRSFRKEQRAFFFGRDEEADELVSIVTAHSAVLFYSQSGAGKTSLLNAKLIPKLEEEECFLVLPPMRVQGQLPANLEIETDANIFVLNALMSSGDIDPVRSNMKMSFHEFVSQCSKRTNEYGEPAPTVMVFDQFEELFTSYPARWADREDFFRQIGEALEGNPKKGLAGNPLLRVIFCMREDYIAELDPYLPLLPEKLRTRFRLEHLREKKALIAIKKPLEKTNRAYASGVAEELVKNLLRIPTQSTTGMQTTGLYVEPVQLQVVCQSLWDALTPEDTVITAEHLQKYGDVSKALSNFYETSIKSVFKDTGITEETLRRWFGETLITPEGTRAPVYRGKDATGGLPNAAIDKLEAMRLIKGEWKGTNVRWYELAHDRFIEPIRRSNEKWLANQPYSEQVRLQLEERAAKWQSGTKLLNAEELLEAQRIVRANVASPSLRTLVDASHASAQKRRIRLLSLILVACGVAVVIFLVVAVYAWKKGNLALRSEREAKLAEGVAKSRLLAVKASKYLTSDPELSVVLAKYAIDSFADTKSARDVIRSGLLSLSNVSGALREHDAKVASAEFSLDGKFIITRTIDNKARLWDAGTRKLLKVLSDNQDSNSASFSPDGKLIVTGGTDGVVRIYDGTSGTPVRELQGHTAQVHRAIFSPDGTYIVSASDDNTVRVWKVATGEAFKVLRGHTAAVNEVTFSPDKIHFATEAADETAMIWSLDSDQGKVLTGLTGTKAALAFDPDGKLIATEGGPGTELGALPEGDYPVTVWDVATGKMKFRLRGHRDYIAGVSFSRDGAIVTSSGDSTARLWTADGQLVKELRGHTRQLSGAIFSPDGQFVVTASADNTLRVWDSLDGKLVTEFRGHSQPVNNVAFSSDGQFIVSASDDQTARLWLFRPGSGATSSTIESRDHSAAVTSIACSPDGLAVAATTRDGKLWVDGVGMQRSVPFTYLVDRSAKVANVRFSPDGRSIATTRGSSGVIYNIDALQQFVDSARSEFVYKGMPPPFADKRSRVSEPDGVKLNGHTADINSIAFSPDGRFVVTASADTTARVWDAATGVTAGELRGHSKGVNSAAFSPDGKFIVTASDDATVRLWDAARFTFVRTIGDNYPRVVSSAEYSPDGRFIVAASGQAAWVSDPNQGKVVRELEGHTEQVNSASFSPDSRLIITASADNTARVWNAQTGESIATLLGHKGPVLNALFSPDGRLVFTASEDYATRIYPREAFAPFDELRGLISQRVARELTPKEREDYLMELENSQ